MHESNPNVVARRRGRYELRPVPAALRVANRELRQHAAGREVVHLQAAARRGAVGARGEAQVERFPGDVASQRLLQRLPAARRVVSKIDPRSMSPLAKIAAAPAPAPDPSALARNFT